MIGIDKDTLVFLLKDLYDGMGPCEPSTYCNERTPTECVECRTDRLDRLRERVGEVLRYINEEVRGMYDSARIIKKCAPADNAGLRCAETCANCVYQQGIGFRRGLEPAVCRRYGFAITSLSVCSSYEPTAANTGQVRQGGKNGEGARKTPSR